MADFLEEIRSHFNILLEEEALSLTLINPNITAEVMHDITSNLNLLTHLTTIEIVIIECPSFDDELLTILAQGMPRCLKQLSLDFTGCESLRGQGFLELFEKLDGLQLTKLSLDLGSLYDINDIVVEGLTLLLSNLTQSLQEFYLDLYEVDQITEEGYLLLAEAITDLEHLKRLHLDFSANYNLTEDSLEILFAGRFTELRHLTFKILDTEEIGGGSFFKFAESLGRLSHLQELTLTISTFSNLNHKGVYSIIRAIGKLETLKRLNLNLSNIDLPEKVLTYLAISPSLQELVLDISCNRKITFGDFLNFGTKIKGLMRIELNLDFCTGISEDAVEEVVTMISNSKKCRFLTLNDRNYSLEFQSNVIPILMNLDNLLEFNVSTKTVSKKLKVFQAYLRSKKKLLWVVMGSRAREYPFMLTRAIMQQLFY